MSGYDTKRIRNRARNRSNRLRPPWTASVALTATFIGRQAGRQHEPRCYRKWRTTPPLLKRGQKKVAPDGRLGTMVWLALLGLFRHFLRFRQELVCTSVRHLRTSSAPIRCLCPATIHDVLTTLPKTHLLKGGQVRFCVGTVTEICNAVRCNRERLCLVCRFPAYPLNICACYNVAK